MEIATDCRIFHKLYLLSISKVKRLVFKMDDIDDSVCNIGRREYTLCFAWPDTKEKTWRRHYTLIQWGTGLCSTTLWIFSLFYCILISSVYSVYIPVHKMFSLFCTVCKMFSVSCIVCKMFSLLCNVFKFLVKAVPSVICLVYSVPSVKGFVYFLPSVNCSV